MKFKLWSYLYWFKSYGILKLLWLQTQCCQMKNAVAVIILSLIVTMLHEKTGCVIPHYRGLKKYRQIQYKKRFYLQSYCILKLPWLRKN